MRKIVLISSLFAAFLAGSLSAQAQGKSEINVYLGGFNGEYTKTDVSRDNSMDLYAIYKEQYTLTSGPVFTLEYNYKLRSWLSAGMQVNYSQLTGTVFTRIDDQVTNEYTRNFFYILPEAKFRVPLPWRHFRLYGKVAAGIRLEPSAPVTFAYDLVPIGIEWGGQRVYGTAELSLGSVIMGGRIGMGFRF